MSFNDDNDNDEPLLGIFDTLMLRGERLRQLRQLAQKDDEERQNQKQFENNRNKRQSNDESKMVISNESMKIVHANNNHNNHNNNSQDNMMKIIYDSSNHLTNSTMCSSNCNSLNGEDKNNDFDCIIMTNEEKDYNDDDNGYIIDDEEEGVDQIDILPDSKLRILRYDSYLAHQRYNDDYKHADCHFVDFGIVVGRDVLCQQKQQYHNDDNDNANRLIVEQQKSLGKGGLVWDAGVILADHLIATKHEWSTEFISPMITKSKTMTKIVELGAGTGVTGLMIAKAVANTHVYITDLPDVLRLIERNTERNFHHECIIKASSSEIMITDEDLVQMDRGEAAQEVPKLNAEKLTNASSQLSTCDLEAMYGTIIHEDNVEKITFKQSNTSHVTAKVLRWGMEEDYCDGPFDLIIAGDVVTSLYDPAALAKTIYDLCHDKSIVYICVKKRLSKYHTIFDDSMKSLFMSVTTLTPITRHRNIDNICIMRASEKKLNTTIL